MAANGGASDPPKTGRERSLANLKNWQKGRSGNPNPANNGASKRAAVLSFMSEIDPDEPDGHERLRYTLEGIYKRSKGIDGSDLAGKVLIEQCAGRASVSKEELQIMIAEHLRKVERDRVDLVLRMLGDERLATMDPKTELVPLILECASNTRGFLDIVEGKQALDEAAEDGIAAPTDEEPKP